MGKKKGGKSQEGTPSGPPSSQESRQQPRPTRPSGEGSSNSGPQQGPKPTAWPLPRSEPQQGPKPTAWPLPRSEPQQGPKPTAWPLPRSEPQQGPKPTAWPLPRSEPQQGPKPTAWPLPRSEPQQDPSSRGWEVQRPEPQLEPKSGPRQGTKLQQTSQSSLGSEQRERQQAEKVKPQKQQPQRQQERQTSQKQSPQGKKAQQSGGPPTKQQTDQSIGKVTAQMKKMGLMTIPRRSKAGNSGAKMMVEVNHLQLDLSRICKEIIHYDIAVDPEKPKRLIRTAVDAFARKHFPSHNTAFDGKKNLYAARKLPFGRRFEDSVQVKNPERHSNNLIEFKVAIQEAQVLSTKNLAAYMEGENIDIPQSVIQAIDVILRTAPLRGVCVPVGRSYFTQPSNLETAFDLGGGLQLWYGFYQSAILGWKPFLNVDIAHKGFPKPVILTRLLMDVCNLTLDEKTTLSNPDIRKFKSMVCSLKIDYEIPNQPNSKRTYRINNLGESCNKYKFKSSNRREMNISDYFLREKRYRIKYPNLPTIQVDPPQKGIYLPMELCRMKPGQTTNRKLDDKQTATMVKEAAKPPDDRKKRILDAIRIANYGDAPAIKDFMIGVSSNFQRVNARVLEAPRIEYTNFKNPQPAPGQWRPGKFINAVKIAKWCIFCLDRRTNLSQLQTFSTDVRKQGADLGMSINPVSEIKTMEYQSSPATRREILKEFQRWKNSKVELVFVVIPPMTEVYATVKQIAELDVGLLTQCIRGQTMYKMNPSTCGNILLKVNSKRNGVNHGLDNSCLPNVLRKPIMLVGMDVTHPSPDQTNIPSVAAVSASFDPKCFKYNMIWRLQSPRVEIIEDLANIMKEHLIYFRAKARSKPVKIIVYRDGVSEGQFQQVMAAELTAIRRACTLLEPDYQPGITFLVVQKRHHIRLFPLSPEFMDGKNKNVVPGTIVDSIITHPRDLDFYLVSHSSLQGTSRPTKYHRLWDDNDISENELEILTYYLCYLFSRCTRSVSYPAPTYYAHLAAFRARIYLENQSFPVTPEGLKSFQDRNFIEPNFADTLPMFFV